MKIRVVIARAGCQPIVTEIESSLSAMQKVVGGYLDCVRVGGLDLWVNDEGLLEGLPFNRMIEGVALVGPILVAGSNEEGDTIGLTDGQVVEALDLLTSPVSEVFA
jgi:hypothetical protein